MIVSPIYLSITKPYAPVNAAGGQNFAPKITAPGHASAHALDSRDGAERRKRGEVSHRVPAKKASVPPLVGQAKASNGAAFGGFFASVPVVPLKKHGKGRKGGKTSMVKLMRKRALTV